MKGPGERFSHSLAVAIGVDEYQHGITPLRAAVADARAVADVLERDHGFATWKMLDHEASLDAILTLIREELPARLGADSRLVFYFAGHGVALDADEGPAGFLLPATARRHDHATFLPMHVLHGELSKLRARHVLIILDCCFAGTFRWSSLRDLDPEPATICRERYDRFVESPAWQVLTSASSDELAFDVLSADRGEGQGRNSPFACALVDGLSGKADYTGDNLVTAMELALYLRERVEPTTDALGRRQTPQYFALARHDRGQFVFQVPNTTLALPAAPPLTAELNPYRGLDSYEEKHHGLFFGRVDATARLTAAIEAQQLTVVVGPSGCGKSSLVSAGALPVLRSRGWTVLSPRRPGRRPLVALQELASELAGQLVEGDPVAAWHAALANRAGRYVVVIDQFEELITQRTDADDLVRFVDALEAALAESSALHIVLTVRADAEPQFRECALRERWKRFPVPVLTREELRAVIEQPAAAFVLHFEPSSLVDRLIEDVALVPAPLPLLSFALSELYRACWSRERANRDLRETDYLAMDSVAGALTYRASSLFKALCAADPAMAYTVRNVFIRMVAVVSGQRARRRVVRGEFAYGDEREDRRVEEVLQRFHEARLISLGVEKTVEGGELAYAEPTHDELVRGWPKVTHWLDELEDVPGMRALLVALPNAVVTWLDHARDAAFLWSDPRVALAEKLHRDGGRRFNAAEAAFIVASAQRMANAERGRRRRRDQLIGGLGVVAVVFAVLAGVAFWQRGEAVRSATREREARTAAERSERLEKDSAALARGAAERAEQAAAGERQAKETAQTSEQKATASAASAKQRAEEAERANRALLAENRATLGRQLAVQSSALPNDPELALLLAAHSTRLVDDSITHNALNAALRRLDHLVEKFGGSPTQDFPPRFVVDMAPDGKDVAIGRCAGWMESRGVAGHAIAGLGIQPKGLPADKVLCSFAVTSIARSADGLVIAAARSDRAVVWNARGDKLSVRAFPAIDPSLHQQSDEGGRIVALDGPGATLAVARQRVTLWSVADGKQLRVLSESDAASALVFLDARRVGAGFPDGRIQMWNAATGETVARGRARGAVTSIIAMTDGRLASIGGSNANVWRIDGAKLVEERAIEVGYAAATVSGDGRRLAVARGDVIEVGPLLDWRPQTTSKYAAFASVERLSSDHVGRYLAYGSEFRGGVIDTQPLRDAIAIPGLRAGTRAYFVTPDHTARHLLVAVDGGAEHRLCAVGNSALDCNPVTFSTYAFDPAAERIVVVEGDKVVLRSVPALALIRVLGSVPNVTELAFDGQRVAAHTDTELVVLDASGGVIRRCAFKDLDTSGWFALSPDFSVFVTTANIQTQIRWHDATTCKRFAMLTAPRNSEFALGNLVFLRDGSNRLLTSADNAVQEIPRKTATGQLPELRRGIGALVATSSNGRHLLTYGASEWMISDVVTGTISMRTPSMKGSSAALSGDGRTLVILEGDRVRLVDIAVEKLRARVCERLSYDLASDQWNRYAPGAPYEPLCRR